MVKRYKKTANTYFTNTYICANSKSITITKIRLANRNYTETQTKEKMLPVRNAAIRKKKRSKVQRLWK